MGKGTVKDMRVAKTAAATTFEDEGVQAAGDNTRRRIAAANSRDNANTFWTSMMTKPASAQGQKTTTG